MADNVALPLSGTGQATANVATDDIGGVQYQRVKINFGADGSATDVSPIDPLPVEFGGTLPAGNEHIGRVTVDNFPAVGVEDTAAPASALVIAGTDGVNTKTLLLDANNSLQVAIIGTQPISGTITVQDGGGSLTVDAPSWPLPTGAATAALQTQPGVDIGDVTINNAAGASAVNVQDGGNSLTVDNAALSVVGGGLEATAQRVTLASDSTGVLSVDDNGGSITVDATSLPLPTGAATSALQTQPGVDIGDVTINNAAGAAAVNIQDGGNSITVDNAILSTVGPGTEAAAQRVTIANDSTGVLSVDDNGASLTVDGSLAITGLPVGANNIGDVDVLTLPGLATGSNTIGSIASIVAGLPTGANTIGAVTVSGSIAVSSLPAGANNIGDIDVLTMPGTVTEDAVSTGGEVAHLNAGIRNDNGVAQTSANGDYGIISLDSGGRVGIADLGGSITVDGSVAVTGLPTGANTIGGVNVVAGLPTGANTIGAVTASGNFPVTDAGGTLTVDNPILSVVGGGTEATAQRVTIASDSTGVISVDDNGGSLTVDGSVAVTGLPTGANTIGAVASIVAGLPTGANTIGAVTASGNFPVTDAGGSLTVDNPTLSVVGGGTEATALRVTLASDSTGLVSVDDNGGSLTVDGSVAVTGLPAGSNTIGNVVVNSITAGLPTGANTIGDVTISGTVPLPTGAATSAKQDTIIGHVDGIETLLGTIDADTGVLAATDFATEAKQDTIIGHLDSVEELLAVGNRAVNIPGIAHSTSQYATGICLSVTGDLYACCLNGTIYKRAYGATSFTSLAQTTRQWFGLTATPAGNIYATVQSGDIYMQTGGTGDFVALGGTSRAWRGCAASVGNNVYAVVYGGDIYMQTAGTGAFNALSQTSRNWAGICVDFTQGDVYACVYGGDVYKQTAGSGNFIAMGTQSKNWYGVSAVNGVLYLAEYLGYIYKLENGILTRVNAFPASVWTGVVAGNQWSYNNPSGYNPDSTIYASTGDWGNVYKWAGSTVTVDGAVSVSGGVAHDSVDSGSPVKIGAKAIAHGANPTAVAAGDRTDLYSNRHGVQFVIGGHPNIQTLRVPITAAQTDVSLVTVSAGTKIVVTKVSVLSDHATTVDVAARVGFGATTTPTGAGVIVTHPGIAPGSGVVEGTGAGIIGIGADGEDLRITSEVPTTGAIDVLVTYYTIES